MPIFNNSKREDIAHTAAKTALQINVQPASVFG